MRRAAPVEECSWQDSYLPFSTFQYFNTSETIGSLTSIRREGGGVSSKTSIIAVSTTSHLEKWSMPFLHGLIDDFWSSNTRIPAWFILGVG